MEKTPEEIAALEEQNKKDDEGKEAKPKKETYSASEYGEVLTESIARRKEIKTLKESLKGFEEAETKAKEADLEAKDLLKLRDDEIKQLKQAGAQTELRNTATTALLEQGFPAKLIKVGLPNDLTDDNVSQKVKDFAKDFKEYIVKEEKKATPANNPFQPGTEAKEKNTPSTRQLSLAAQEMIGKK